MNLTFANPALLWGALLVSVPILIHLLNRRRYRVVRWAAQEFLLQAYQRTRRRLTLESLLLLLLRCALVLLLAVALARPFAPSDSLLSLVSRGQRNVVLVVDTSYSMGRRLAGGDTVLDRARGHALRLIDGLSAESGDQVTIATLSAAPRIVQSATSDLQRAKDVLERLEPEWTGADLVRTLDFLTESVLGQGRRDVYLLTDLQRTTFLPGGGGDDVAALVGEALPASAWRVAAAHDAKFYVVDVGLPEPPRNLVVEELVSRPANVVEGEAVRVSAAVRNRTGSDVIGATGTFVFSGRRDQARTVRFDVPANGVAAVETSTVFPGEGSAAVEFTIDEDELPADDRRFLAFPVHEAVPVLVVDGESHEPQGRSAASQIARFLNPALDPETGASPFRVKVVDDRRFNLGGEDPSTYRMIVLANVARVDAKVARELDEAVRAGRGLLVFLGDLVDARAWNERFHAADGSGLMPGRLLGPKGDPDPRSDHAFRPMVEDYAHPVLQLFETPELRGLPREVRVRRFFDVEPTPNDPTARALVLLDDDVAAPSPLLIEKPAGRGRVLVLTTSHDRAWTDFEEDVPFLLPLLHEAAVWLTMPDLSRFNLVVGERLRKTSRSIPSAAVVVTPDGSHEPIEEPWAGREYGEFVLPVFDATGTPGVYRLELEYPLTGAAQDAGRREVEQYAVNVDVRESDLARLEPEAFARLYPGVEVTFLDEIRALPRETRDAREGDLWRALLWTLLALLAVESLVAWHIGRGRRGAAA